MDGGRKGGREGRRKKREIEGERGGSAYLKVNTTC